VHAPALSILGLSTHKEFYESLQSGQLDNGFVNRFLVLSSDRRSPEQDDPQDGHVPEGMARDLLTLYEWGGGSFTGVNVINKDLQADPDVRTWANDRAKAGYKSFKTSIEDRMYGDDGLGAFLGRSAEIAVRLATIRGAGRHVGNYDFKVDESDIEWAIAVVRVCSDSLIAEAGGHMVEDLLTHGQAHNRIIGIIRKEGRISHSKLMRKVQKTIKGKEFNAILEQLEQSETIKVVGVRPLSGGPLAKTYSMGRP